MRPSLFFYLCSMDTKLITYLQNICSKREYCNADLVSKIKSYYKDGTEVSEEEINALLDSLRKDNFLDDRRYTRAFVRDKAVFNAWGPSKLSQALRLKGIDASLINEALNDEELQNSALAKLEKQLQVKNKSLRDDPQAKIKLIRFALSKGFDYSAISELVDKVCTSSHQ